MDLTLSESERLVQKTCRDLLDKEVTRDLVARSEESGEFNRELWNTIARQGWFGLGIPADREGSGGSITEWLIALEEMGRACCPLPVPEQAAVGQVLSRHSNGSPVVLRSVLTGEEVVSAALVDHPGGLTTATVEGDSEVILNGEKLLAPYAQAAGYLVVRASRDGIGSFFLCSSRQPGVTTTPMRSMSEDQRCRVTLQGTRATLLGSLPEDKLSDFGEVYTLARDAYCLGLTDRMLELSVSYARDRVQFGRPIGSFQAIQHRVADAAVVLHGARLLLYQAGWLLAEQGDAVAELAMAHAYIRQAAGEVTAHAHQIHGAMGFTYDYQLQFFSRRAKAYQHSLGQDTAFLERVAQRYAESTPAAV
jgi:alkylation response protein AidB-like acyl-CoA dehydrogenase